MSGQDSFSQLMQRLRDGDDDAARQVFERFTRRLVGLARQHLDSRLARKVDPEDVVQSAYKSFFIRHREAEYDIGGWDGLWGLLTLIALRKCADQAAYFRTEKRDVRREMLATADTDSTPFLDNFALTREPLPQEAAELAEMVEELFRAISDPEERTILEFSLQGFSAAEISETIGRAERSVRRIRERIRKRLERMRDELS